MTGELDILGVYVPPLFAWMVFAFALSWPLRAALGWLGFYRYVWHRPLFDVALYVVLLGAIVNLTTRVSS